MGQTPLFVDDKILKAPIPEIHPLSILHCDSRASDSVQPNKQANHDLGWVGLGVTTGRGLKSKKQSKMRGLNNQTAKNNKMPNHEDCHTFL